MRKCESRTFKVPNRFCFFVSIIFIFSLYSRPKYSKLIFCFMKKILFFVALFAGICMIAIGAYGWNVYSNSAKGSLLFMENVEVLFRGESVDGYTKSFGECSRPCEYKAWGSCKSGDPDECYPSDCC